MTQDALSAGHHTRGQIIPEAVDSAAGGRFNASDHMLLLTCPPAALAKGGKSCHTRVVSDLFLIMPTAGEYRVVEAVVRTLPLAR